MIDPFFAPVTVALITMVAALLERRHSKRIARLDEKNSQEHNRSYGLLQSIDTRTIKIQSSLVDHGERIAVLETDREIRAQSY